MRPYVNIALNFFHYPSLRNAKVNVYTASAQFSPGQTKFAVLFVGITFMKKVYNVKFQSSNTTHAIS